MLVLVHDFTSLGSAVAMLRLQTLADEGFDIGFEGFDRYGLGLAIPAPLDLLEDWQLNREAALSIGLDASSRPRVAPPTIRAHLLAELATTLGRGAAARRLLVDRYWADGRDLDDDVVLDGVAEDVGITEVWNPIGSDREAVRARRGHMLLRRSAGVGGVPVLDVDGTLTSADVGMDDLRALAAL